MMALMVVAQWLAGCEDSRYISGRLRASEAAGDYNRAGLATVEVKRVIVRES